MKKILRRIHRDDSAQVLAMFALLSMVIIGLMGLASDVGRIYVARAELGRSVDAAALAGAKQLPNVSLADTKARAFISENEPSAIVSVEVYPNAPSQQVEVRATKTVSTVFMQALGIGSVDVRNEATAGFGVVPVDAVLAIDNTGSMASALQRLAEQHRLPDLRSEERVEGFTNTLLPGANTLVGVTGFRGCFRPSGTNTTASRRARSATWTVTPSNVISKIDAMNGNGGSGTNVCSGLDMANSVLTGSNSHAAANTQRDHRPADGRRQQLQQHVVRLR